jgi:hypothetical protein
MLDSTKTIDEFLELFLGFMRSIKKYIGKSGDFLVPTLCGNICSRYLIITIISRSDRNVLKLLLYSVYIYPANTAYAIASPIRYK